MENAQRIEIETPLIQLVIPIYNEGGNISRLYKSILKEGFDFDSLKFIYDIDTDTSLPFIKDIAEIDKRVRAEKNCFGRGVLNALRWGFSNAKPGPVIVIMGDNSDKLSIIPEMIKLWESGSTVVCPSRYIEGGKQHGGPFLKSLLSKIQGKVIKFLGFPTADPTNNFKLYDGEWISSQEIQSSGGFEVALELCYKAYTQNKLITELPTEWWDRTEGQSNFRLWSWLPKYLRWYLMTLKAVLSKHVGVG